MSKSTSILATLVICAGSTIAFAQANGSPIVLITEQEAQLPDAVDVAMTRRAGVTRGPKVQLVAPASGNASSPVHLQVQFQSFGGAKIDPASVSVRYLKDPAIDLTPRLKPAIGPAGIDVEAAQIPPGTHDLRVDVKDSEGRSGTATFKLIVAR